MSLAQMHYRFRRKPTRADVEHARKHWLKTGKAPAGVKMRVIAFDGKGLFWFKSGGCPGIVSDYHVPGRTLCDYDTKAVPSMEQALELSRRLGVRIQWLRMDRTRRGWHVVIQWGRKWSPIETVAIQAILGSDPGRESFNMARLVSGGGRSRHWNLLFGEKL